MTETHTHPLYFIEKLTISSWLGYIFPYLFSRRSDSAPRKKVYFIDGSWPGIWAAWWTAAVLNVCVERLNFRLIDVRDAAGNLIHLQIRSRDMAEVQKAIAANLVFQGALKAEDANDRLRMFLTKQLFFFDVFCKDPLQRIIFLVRVAAWHTARERRGAAGCVLFLSKKIWLKEIRDYARKHGVTVQPVRKRELNWKAVLFGILGSCVFFLKDYCSKHGLRYLIKKMSSKGQGAPLPVRFSGSAAMLAVEYYGHLNLDHPELHSDLFFWQRSRISAEDILIVFGMNQEPLDREKWAEITGSGMHAISLTPRVAKDLSAPVFHYSPWKGLRKRSSDMPLDSPEGRHLRRLVNNYHAKKSFWTDFFEQNRVRIYLFWHRQDPSRCIIADALEHLGGITAVYQRSYEEFPLAKDLTTVDIMFGFSTDGAKIEKRSGSVIPYHVTVGYYGDHRSPLLRQKALELRSRLQQRGVRHILAFFDENSTPDPRWHTGHEFMSENYQFLSEKVLENPGFGLIFKPKSPRNLRQRLGRTAGLLKRAEETGRCFVLEGGPMFNAFPPVLAALASDIAVHGHLFAATAGIESALSGTPTLLMDREGWHLSKLHRLGRNVVFTHWEDLWKTLMEHWHSPTGIPGFGDWSSMIGEMDPFRDGRAAERMGTYLKWLLDGFKGGLPRETIMADAAQRYSEVWGADKIKEVNSPHDTILYSLSPQQGMAAH